MMAAMIEANLAKNQEPQQEKAAPPLSLTTVSQEWQRAAAAAVRRTRSRSTNPPWSWKGQGQATRILPFFSNGETHTRPNPEPNQHAPQLYSSTLLLLCCLLAQREPRWRYTRTKRRRAKGGLACLLSQHVFRSACTAPEGRRADQAASHSGHDLVINSSR
jgi:hypothetical protein